MQHHRPKDYKRAVVVDAEVNEANQTTLGSARRSVITNNLTEPTLLEMSGYQASGIESVTLARFAVLILRPVNTGGWAHSTGGRLASLFPISVKHPERRYV
jgi:hypothetical protein